MADEGRLSELDNYEKSDKFTEREKVALRYTDKILWDPASADDAFWEQLHKHFTEPELVELGHFIGFTSGGQRWILTLGIKHGEVLPGSAAGLSQKIVASLGAQPPADD